MNSEENSLLNNAVAKLHIEDYYAAKLLVKVVLKKNSKSFNALNLMGVLEGIEGNHFDASIYFKKALKLNKNDNFLYFNLAKSLSEIGADLEGLDYHVKATQLAPKHKEAWLNYGHSFYKLGQHENALVCFDKALSIDDNFLHAMVNKALALTEIGRSEEALYVIERSLGVDPQSYEAIKIKGRIYLNLRKYEDAINEFNKAVDINPNNIESWLNLGLGLRDYKLFEEALKCFERALEINPQSVEAMSGQALAMHELNRNEEALISIERLLASNPLNINALVIKGNINAYLRKHEEAILDYDKVIKKNPQFIESYERKGILFLDLNRHEEALCLFDKALQLDPNYISAIINKGFALHSLKRYEEAVLSYERAIILDPNNSDAHYNLACTLFCQFKFEPAWKYYEWRFKKMNHQESKKVTNLIPKWDGVESNKTIFILAEQGLGDQILHLSILPKLEKYTNKFIVSVDSKLILLLSRSFPEITFIDRKSQIDLQYIDEQIPMASLGSIFRNNVKDFPKFTNYIKSRKDNLIIINRKKQRKIIGISWKSANNTRLNAKNIPVEIFSKLLINNDYIHWVNLQYGSISDEFNFFKNQLGVEIDEINGVDFYENIDDLACVISQCEIVVTISNITAHIAGAMGKKVVLLLPYANNKLWYWEDINGMSIWYPSVMCFKQKTPGCWDEVIHEVKNYLGSMHD
jgi:tetratricopeptide (TPR) repeat protein